MIYRLTLPNSAGLFLMANAAIIENDIVSLPVSRKRARKNNLRKTAPCFQYEKTGVCSYADCKFAHGSDELIESGSNATRKLIRTQATERQAIPFVSTTGTDDLDSLEVQPFVARTGSMINRYYTRFYQLDIEGRSYEDQYIYMHSNRLAVIGIAPSHRILKEGLTILEIRFDVGPHGKDLLSNKVSGKKKKGGMWLEANSPLCRVKCKGEEDFIIKCCIRGSLLEPNEALISSPSLLSSHAENSGFIAIIRPKTTEIMELQQSLKTRKEYEVLRRPNDL